MIFCSRSMNWGSGGEPRRSIRSAGRGDGLPDRTGARTTESQTHREMSPGLSTPVGFKNGTSGDSGDGGTRCYQPPLHAFLGINDQGRVAIVRTKGNPHGHRRSARWW